MFRYKKGENTGEITAKNMAGSIYITYCIGICSAKTLI